MRLLLSLLIAALTSVRLAAQSAAVSTNSAGSGASNATDIANRDLRAGDTLRYTISEDPVNSNGIDPMEVFITEIGDAHFPVSRGTDRIVTLVAKGKQLDDLRKELTKRLEEDYYHHATVSLNLYSSGRKNLSGVGPKAIFFGEVKGTVPLLEGERKTITEAIIQMGYSEWADLRKVKISRKSSSGKPEIVKVNVDEIMKKNLLDKDIELKDGDRVDVPAKTFRLGN
ncbi:MAG: hypothetical protein EXS36_14425 [Pedosphaera sp.]|nr:hypothetical protein [Pedosphaera sp.]